jgi:alkylation response protein AidB-like acyl-CoA dehydrogenase
VDFRFDPEERDLIRQAAATISAQLSAGRLLSQASSGAGWAALGKDGWLHAGLDEDLGGGGMPLPLLAGVAREAGRSAAGDGFTNNAALIPRLVVAAAGRRALDEHAAHPGFLVCDGRSTALHCADIPEPTGWCFGVEPGLDAYCLLQDGRLVRYSADAWSFEPTGILALGVGTVRISADASPEEIGTVDEVPGDIVTGAQVLHAAALTGVGEKALRITVDHVLIREQFGNVLGRFQAVKHTLADAAMRLEVAWNAVIYASLRPAEPAAVPTALLQAATAGDDAVRAMTQLHGGIAITWEHPAHLYLKTAETGRWRFGAADDQALRIASAWLGLQEPA